MGGSSSIRSERIHHHKLPVYLPLTSLYDGECTRYTKSGELEQQVLDELLYVGTVSPTT